MLAFFRKHCMLYHIFQIPKDVQLLHYIDFGIEIGLSIFEDPKKEDVVERLEDLVASQDSFSSNIIDVKVSPVEELLVNLCCSILE